MNAESRPAGECPGQAGRQAELTAREDSGGKWRTQTTGSGSSQSRRGWGAWPAGPRLFAPTGAHHSEGSAKQGKSAQCKTWINFRCGIAARSAGWRWGWWRRWGWVPTVSSKGMSPGAHEENQGKCEQCKLAKVLHGFLSFRAVVTPRQDRDKPAPPRASQYPTP